MCRFCCAGWESCWVCGRRLNSSSQFVSGLLCALLFGNLLLSWSHWTLQLSLSKIPLFLTTELGLVGSWALTSAFCLAPFYFSHWFVLLFHLVSFFISYCFPWSNSLWPYLFYTDWNKQAMNFENKVKEPCGSEFLFHQVWLSDSKLHFQSLFQAPLERPCPLHWLH